MGVFSFNGNKIITTSGGGALISDDRKLIEKPDFWQHRPVIKDHITSIARLDIITG